MQDRFRDIEEQYFLLRGQLAMGRLTHEQFEAKLKELMFQDAQGRYWMIGAETSKWYMHDGVKWVEANPVTGAATTLAATNLPPPPTYVSPPTPPTTRSGPNIMPWVVLGFVLIACLVGGIALMWYGVNQGFIKLDIAVTGLQPTATLVAQVPTQPPATSTTTSSPTTQPTSPEQQTTAAPQSPTTVAAPPTAPPVILATLPLASPTPIVIVVTTTPPPASPTPARTPTPVPPTHPPTGIIYSAPTIGGTCGLTLSPGEFIININFPPGLKTDEAFDVRARREDELSNQAVWRGLGITRENVFRIQAKVGNRDTWPASLDDPSFKKYQVTVAVIRVADGNKFVAQLSPESNQCLLIW